LSDLDRVLNINPENVLAYFNRASVFIELGMYENAIEDYDMAIDLYPDFAKAYMNRSYVKNLLGDVKSSKRDYDIAQRKVREYREKNVTSSGSFADTTKKYSSLLALDADFAKKDFNDELLQNRDINVRLRELYKFALANSRDDVNYALDRGYENPLLAQFQSSLPVAAVVTNNPEELSDAVLKFCTDKTSFPRHFRLPNKNTFIVIKTTATSLEEFKTRGANGGNTTTEPKEAKTTAADEIHPGLYDVNMTFRRAVVNPETRKCCFVEETFEAEMLAQSQRQCFEVVIEHLKNHPDVDSRSQYPSIRSSNFKAELISE
jgi:tetratricopeptide (TPR) repeat protein